MTPPNVLRQILAAGLLLVSACGGKNPAEQPQPASPPAVQSPPAATNSDPELLRSAAVKDAIHRALTTGRNQRWQDGALSGYAVPSREALPNGCRTVRYTVDQRPDAPMTTINACEGSR